ncbi:MAG: general secretion pathway protein GspB [Aquabacterium sp.]
MSYILDALKKADAERERGTVPGLHSQPMAPTPDDDDEPAARGTTLPIVWVGAGVALCLIAVLSWQLLTREPAAPSSAAPTGVPADTAATASPQAPVQTQEQPQVAMTPPASTMPAQPTMQPAQTPAQMPTQPPAQYAMRPPVPQPSTRNQRATAEPTPTAPAQHQAQANTAPPAATTTTPPATAALPQRVPTLQELPDDIRREIPPLTIGGAMYSETPASRMLIVNSQVFHEGDKPYQGLTLEEIRLKSAVFSYRGYRYSIQY